MAEREEDTETATDEASPEREPEREATTRSSKDIDDDDEQDDEEDEDEDEEEEVVKKVPKRAARAEAPKIEESKSIPLGSVAHLAFVILAAIGVYSFVSVAKEGEMRRRCSPTCILRPNYSGYERKAPNFKLRDTRGHEISLESYRGRVVVLNFWTKTCGPCMEEMPEIADLSRILKPLGDVDVVTVSTDETAEDATNTLKSVLRDEAPFPVLMDPDSKVVRGMFGTSLYPETWIIDKNGVIRARFDGAREWSSATVVELVNQIRGGGYCPVQAREGKFTGEGARICDTMSGG